MISSHGKKRSWATVQLNDDHGFRFFSVMFCSHIVCMSHVSRLTHCFRNILICILSSAFAKEEMQRYGGIQNVCMTAERATHGRGDHTQARQACENRRVIEASSPCSEMAREFTSRRVFEISDDSLSGSQKLYFETTYRPRI